jgi:hypothetical protein
MPGAGVVHHIIFDRFRRLSLPVHIRFAPKADVRLTASSAASIKDNRFPKFSIVHTIRQHDLSPASLTISPGNFRSDRRDSRFFVNVSRQHDLTTQKLLLGFPKFEVGHIHSQARC